MSNPLWPASLPQQVLVDGYKRSFGVGVVRTPMEIGPAKQRQRFTAVPQPFSAMTEVDRTQLATFQAFWRDTLGQGALPFDWVDPETLAPITFQFIGDQPPSWNPMPGSQVWQIVLTLEILP